MAAAAGPSSGPDDSDGRDGKPVALPERFVTIDDVVAKELSDVEWPWDLAKIEDRIREYSVFSEKINAQLSARVMANYNEFVQGMQQVQAVETELTLIGVLVKNGRRKLQERDKGLVRGSMQVTRQHKKADRLKKLLATLEEFRGVVRMHTRLQECLSQGKEDYCEAIAQLAALKEALADEKFRQFPGLLGLREGLSTHMSTVQQKLSDGLRVAAVSADFDAERYEEILKAYSMMPAEQAFSVGKELISHVCECIGAVSRQCMLMFSVEAAENATDWHRKAQLRELCRSMDPTHFVDCTAKLYEHLCDFLYRHQFLCRWHEYRQQGAESEEGQHSARFREVLREVLSELAASKRNVWHHISQQVSLVLMTLEFQYPALSEENFLHILHLTQMLIDEGDAFMADYQGVRGTTGRAQWSAPIKNTLKSKANDYFQSMHAHTWVSFKMSFIDQDNWQRIPVARSYSLLRKERLQGMPARRDAGTGAASAGTQGDKVVRSMENNPFRHYKPEPLGQGGGLEEAAGRAATVDGSPHEDGDDLDEHALLQHWIDNDESLANEQIGSSMLSNSNRSPVVSSSTVELARVLERHLRMMAALPQLSLDIFQCATQLVEYYIHCVLCLFVQDRHLRVFLEDLDAPLPPNVSPETKLQPRHEALLLQQLFPELRRAALRTREFMAGLNLPSSAIPGMQGQGPLNGAAFLQVTPFPKLTSPSSLCGLSERCVGADSVLALLGDLGELRNWLAESSPQRVPEALDPFLATQEVIAGQLRAFVLRCAASDLLEVSHVGRVSLDHFSNTMQALKWDAKDFSQGSPGAPYVEQLRAQIDELARRIPCAGGGAIPHETQRTVWGWMEVRIMQECAEVIAKCGRKKSQEALVCLTEDFQSIRSAVQQSFKGPADGAAGSTSEPQLLPPENPLLATTKWVYLDNYIEAHGYLPNEVAVWCKRNLDYPYRLHKALVEYLHGGNPKTQRQTLAELETLLTAHIAEKSADLYGVQREGSLRRGL